MSDNLLQLAGVHTHIGAYHILHGVDLTVPRGQLTMLLGRNGAGKTTTLRTIMGLWRASKGSVSFNGQDITQLATPQIAGMNVAAGADKPVPAAVLKMIARSFSQGNSVHRSVADGGPIAWSKLGDAYRGWLSEEPAASLAVRELNLSLTSTHALGNDDVVGALRDAVRHVPEQILSPWYLTYLKRSAALAQVALANGNHELALRAVRDARPFTGTAPTAALTSAAFSTALASLQNTERTLASQSVAEQLSFPVDGAPPVRVTIVRDLAAERIAVLPHQVLLNAVLDNGVFRLGFMSQSGQNVRLRMRGRLTVDPGVIQRIREKYPSAEIGALENEVSYDTVNLGLGDALVSGAATVERDGAIEFDLLLRGTGMARALATMAQPYGIDATINWKHQRLDLGARTARLNIALARTDTAIMADQGLLTNPFGHSLYVDYLLDGSRTITAGFPVLLAPGESVKVSCSLPPCHAPGTAIRRQLALEDLNTWFVSIPATSAVQKYVIENQLEDDAARGGVFRSLVLTVSYSAAANAAPQQVGPFTLGPRGAANAKRTLYFLAPGATAGKLQISGRAYWGQGQSYRDLPGKEVESNITLIDEGWLK